MNLFLALELLTLPWVEPFFPEMGVPQFIIEHPDVWKPIYEEIVPHYEQLFANHYRPDGDDTVLEEESEEEKDNAVTEHYKFLVPRFTLQSLIRSLRQLADIAGKDTAVELEHWVRRHFLSHQTENSLTDWNIILQYAVRPAGSKYNLISPPEFIAEFVPIMENLCSVWKEEEQKERIAAAMPEPTTEELKFEFIGLDSSWLVTEEAMRVNTAIKQQSTLEVIKLLAENLHERQQAEFISWVKLQASNISIVSIKNLRADTFFRADFPFSNSPSLLDLPPTFDLIDYDDEFNPDDYE
jgi:hypothetical protein